MRIDQAKISLAGTSCLAIDHLKIILSPANLL